MNTNRNQLITKRPAARAKALLCGFLVMGILSGCTVGPSLYKSSFNDYNDAIRKTSDGQMLTNLVRMRYLESPVFLQVASLNTSFSVGANAGISGTNASGGPDSVGANVGGSYSENPTITFSLPESKEYYGRLMAPLSANQITMLVEAGYDSEAVMRTSLRRINRLKNLTVDLSNKTPPPPSYDDFNETFRLLKKLNVEGLVEFGPGLGTAVWSAPVSVSPGGLAEAALLATEVFFQNTAGGELIKNEKGEYQLHTFARRLSIRFAPAAANSADAQRVRELLDLDPSRNSFAMLEIELANIEKGRAYRGAAPAALDPEAVWTEVGLLGRSMMEIMQLASTTVQVPAEDLEAGIVFPAPPAPRMQVAWLDIKSSADEPSNATLRIKFRGNWFYIEDSDLESRETFSMLNAMFAVTGGTVPGANPILTLPVN